MFKYYIYLINVLNFELLKITKIVHIQNNFNIYFVEIFVLLFNKLKEIVGEIESRVK